MKTKSDYLESKEFYDLMQCYRIADMMDQETVIKRFKAVKDFIRTKSAELKVLEALQDFVNVYRIIDVEYLLNDEMRAILYKAEDAIKNTTL